MFFSRNPAGCGILLKDAIEGRFNTLEGRDDLMFQNKTQPVAIRLNVRISFDRCRRRREDANASACTVAGIRVLESTDTDQTVLYPIHAVHTGEIGQRRSKERGTLHSGGLDSVRHVPDR